MTSTVKPLAFAALMFTLMSGLFASPARAQGWGRTSRPGPQMTRAMSPTVRGRSQPVSSRHRTGTRFVGGTGQGMQFGRSSAVSVAIGPGGVGVAVGTDNSAVAVAVGGGGVGVGVAKDNGKAVSVAAGSDGVSVGRSGGSSN